ncbi:MAG: hypothetical protein LBT10_06360 [Methanobrevibacter sp.]|jgi:hypothetical protein|nr:hypothetical protein [Methanobrevibacter sp.]
MKSSVKSVCRYSSGKRVYQGDIYRDLRIIDYDYDNNEEGIFELEIPYLIVLSQDCDLQQDYDSGEKYTQLEDKENEDKLRSIHDKFIPSVLLCPAFPAEQVRVGIHLKNYNNLLMDSKGSENKSKWKNILQNETPRYHFIIGDTNLQVPELVLDFKRYYTVPKKYFYDKFENYYLASLNELYREELSRRFTNYLSRIGLPVFDD